MARINTKWPKQMAGINTRPTTDAGSGQGLTVHTGAGAGKGLTARENVRHRANT